jgi:hypothetical protein
LIKADRNTADACDRSILPAGAAGLRVPIDPAALFDPLAPVGRAVAVSVGASVGTLMIVSVDVGVIVGRGVRVDLGVRVGPNVGKGRSVAVGPIGRGVGVGALHAASKAITIRSINNFERISP